MSTFSEDLEKELQNPKFARYFGRAEREFEIVALINKEIELMEEAGGASLDKNKEYDAGYATALGDIMVLIMESGDDSEY